MRVYTVSGVQPEVLAYGLAKYSRSRQSLEESLQEISAQQASDFLNTFYFKYGHASIADMAHVPMAVEEISTLAAMTVVSEPVWDGQERSTRYQDFSKTGFYIPEGVSPNYAAIADNMFQKYNALSDLLYQALTAKHSTPRTMSSSDYRRTLKARAFDVARYWLPLATTTSLGQITSARILERQISRLMSHSLPEVRALGVAMQKAAVERPPFNLHGDGSAPLLPTLVRYAAPNPYWEQVGDRLKVIANACLGNLSFVTADSGARLYSPGDITVHGVTTLLYSVSNHDYGSIRSVVEDMSGARRREIIQAAFDGRSSHDEWLHAFHAAPLVFDVTIDIGSYRDFNRHRRTLKSLQPLTASMGFTIPEPLVELGLSQDFHHDMTAHYDIVSTLKHQDRQHGSYLLPFAHRCRALLQMDIVQAAYMIKLRTGSAGHFSYREVAYQMYERLHEQYPELAAYVAATNPREVYDPFTR